MMYHYSKTKILFMAADPSDASRLRLGQEYREIQERLQLSRIRDKFLLEIRTSLRPGDISQALLDTEPQIVHFSGHGTSAGELCFEDQDGKTKKVQPDAIASLFQLFEGKIHCVILNACYSEIQAVAIAKYVDYVIGMNKAISDEAAITFATGLYKALLAGYSADRAYEFGLVELRLQGIPEHLVPVLKKKSELTPVVPERKGVDITLSDRIAVTTSEIVRDDIDPPELQYSHLFQIASLELPYISLLGGWQDGANEYRKGDVICTIDDSQFQLPKEFRQNTIPDYYGDDAKCRLVDYRYIITAGSLPNIPCFTFSKIGYLDYLKSGEFLDHPLPSDPSITFRDKFASRLDFEQLATLPLSNICGVGLFVITRDNEILVSRHSPHVRVNPNVWGFAACGTMDWSEGVNPFDEVIRESIEEIDYEPNLEDLYLYALGVDTKRLYFQFSFFEHSALSSREIIKKSRLARDFQAEVAELEAIPFEIDAIIDQVKNQSWEPSGAPGLLMLCIKRFGFKQVEKAVDIDFVRTRDRKIISVEWDGRARRTGDLSVMSTRFPSYRGEQESRKYVHAVMDFIGNDIDGKDVLEVGCGNGRISEQIVLRVSGLTCIDISGEMLKLNAKRLGDRAQGINYLQISIQDYRPKWHHNIVLCSQVLNHILDDDEFDQAILALSSYADTVFLFEQANPSQRVSSYTHIRSEQEYVKAFEKYKVVKRQEHKLFDDDLVFLKLVRD